MRTFQFIFVMCVGVLFAGATGLVAVPAVAGVKVEVCHIPPGHPDNFHTIKIRARALSAHLAHGDIAGDCNSACAILCDDGDACTIDDTGDCERPCKRSGKHPCKKHRKKHRRQGCPVTREMIDCNDGNECTADSCYAVDGCVNTPLVGAACDDGETCSDPDICNTGGECVGEAIDGCCLSDDDCSQDLCDQASCNPDTNLCSNNPVLCIPPDLCTVSECASDTGDCVDTAITCPEGETCNVSTGECEDEVDPGVDMGATLGIDFTPQLLVDQLLVEVLDAWLTDPTISLDIEITGINGTFEHHGADLIDVIDTNVFFTDGTIAQTVVDWTTDTITQNVNEVYTICVQPLRNTTELIGSEKCVGFGPF